MWLFSSRKKRSARPVRRPQSHRPQLEALEDRCLLSGLGSLDPTFGSGGLVTTNFAKKSADFAQSVAVQTDGKIVAAGIDSTSGHFFEVARYNTNGTLDTSFGTGGKVLTQFNSSGTGTNTWGFVLQPDGKIVVGATPYPGSGYELVRYNTNGTLDTTFGPNHNGTLITNFAGATFAGIEGLAIESVNGSAKLVAGVWWSNNSGGAHNAFALARYNLDGSLDASFGSGGEVVSPAFLLGCFAKVEALTTQADGKIILGARAQFQYSAPTQFIVARYDTSGNLDPTFGSGGLAALSSTGDPFTLAIQADGKIVAGGQFSGSGGALVRFNVGVAGQADGSLDTSFGAGGIANSISTVYGLVIQANGKLVTAESGVVARYNPDGSLDTGFGNSGSALMPASSAAFAVALQADGKIVAAGQSASSQQTSYDFAVARFLGDPVPPRIGSFTASPNPVTAGSNVTLTASNVVDLNASGSISQVAFYLDSNGDGKLEAGTDTLLGYGTQNGSTWTLTFSTTGWASAIDTLFAQAKDNYGLFSDPFATTLQVI